MLTIAVLAVLAATGCARPVPQAAPARAETVPAADTKDAQVYEQVLRRHLETPADNSFPAHTFKTVYVLDQVRSDAANPMGDSPAGRPLPADVKASLAASLAVTFITDKNSVLDSRNGCATVRGGGILITLGTIDGDGDGDGDQVTVGVNGFVACLGATWLTYVVRHRPGTGWQVTGTTGPMAVA